LDKQNFEIKLLTRALSMGMSGDYQLAIECGGTMVRIGSGIFGEEINFNFKVDDAIRN
jgi:uncharacterized pyridoxal phosphate-containing UPF0001 family protein